MKDSQVLRLARVIVLKSTLGMEYQRRREELVLKYNVKPLGKEKV